MNFEFNESKDQFDDNEATQPVHSLNEPTCSVLPPSLSSSFSSSSFPPSFPSLPSSLPSLSLSLNVGGRRARDDISDVIDVDSEDFDATEVGKRMKKEEKEEEKKKTQEKRQELDINRKKEKIAITHPLSEQPPGQHLEATDSLGRR